MNDYAPLYGKSKRIRLALILAAIFLPLALISHFWLFPAITWYTSYANCFHFGDRNGLQWAFFAAFVALPFTFALLLLLILGPRSLRIIRAGQDPLPGEKVLRKTRYRYGRAALPFPLLTLLLILICVGFSIWGSFQVDKLAFDVVPCSEQQKAELGVNG